jgi:hypothetical protein
MLYLTGQLEERLRVLRRDAIPPIRNAWETPPGDETLVATAFTSSKDNYASR